MNLGVSCSTSGLRRVQVCEKIIEDSERARKNENLTHGFYSVRDVGMRFGTVLFLTEGFMKELVKV